jgi:UDP-glucose 4-epimerase
MAEPKHVVITGVAGFIGSNLSRVLLQRGYRVTGVDNLSNGFMRNIQSLLASGHFVFLKEDITVQDTFASFPADVDYVVHLAAFKIPRYGNILDTLQINYRGTDNVLRYATQCEAKVIFASTSDVYGKNPKVPFKETDDLVIGESSIARWAYAASKIHDEHLCSAYSEKHSTRIAIIRYFGGYGPNQNLTWWGGPQSVFIDAVLNDKPIEIHGDGLQTRSFTFVDDLVDGTIRAMESERSTGEIINIGDEREITILHLAEMVWRLMKSSGNPPLKFIPYTSFFGGKYEDVRRRIPDITKARTLLGYSPKMPLEDGLKVTIEWQTAVTIAARESGRAG